MTKKKVKLKRTGPDGYTPRRCAACGGDSEMIDATRFLHKDYDIPFCCPCWSELNDEYHAANPKTEVEPEPAPEPEVEEPAPEPEVDEPEPETYIETEMEPFRLFG